MYRWECRKCGALLKECEVNKLECPRCGSKDLIPVEAKVTVGA